MRWTAEAKVGLVTIIAVLLFTGVVLSLARVEIFGKPGFKVHTTFQDANGLQKGNSVRYVGVNVGKVEKVTPSRDGVDVLMRIDEGTEIPTDSKISITTDGLLGSKIISITPGEARNSILGDGDIIDGNKGKSMDDVMESANTLIAGANEMVKNLNAVMGDRQTQQAMRGTIQNMEAMTGSMSAMMDANAANIQQLTANMAAITSQMNDSMHRIDGDGATSENVRQMAANMEQISERFENIARSMEDLTTDPQSKADIKTTLHNTAEISSKVNRILGKGSGVRVEGEGGLLYNDTKDKTGAHVNFRVYRDNQFAQFGAEQIGNGTNLNAQYGRRGSFFDSRIGLINGDLGVGFDLFYNKPFRLTLEGYNPNDWRYRIKAQYRIAPDIYLFGQFTHPFKRSDGGNYYGINYTF